MILFYVHRKSSSTLVRVVTHGKNYGSSLALLQQRTLKKEGARIVSIIVTRKNFFSHRLWLTSKCGFITRQLFAFNENTVCGNCVSFLKFNHVTDDQLF